MLNVGSLFSGIGGIDLGLQWAGMKTIWFVEQDKFCQKVLAKHWPGVPIYGDIKEIYFATLPRPDLLCGGFPCQPFSVAGKRQGIKDDRWLWPEFYRAICETKPRWILVENVPGLLSIDSGRVFGGILRDLAASGYDAEWDCIPAATFGAPHLRYRLFLVAYVPDTQSREDDLRIAGSVAEASSGGESINPAIGFSSEALANSQGQPVRPGFCQDESKRERGRRFSDSYSQGDVTNSDSNGLSDGIRGDGSRAETQRIFQGEAFKGCRSSWWSTECRLGIPAHGVFSGLDDCGGWECGVPRIAKGQKNRVSRLKALGNAVVPQVIEWIGRRILKINGGGADGRSK